MNQQSGEPLVGNTGRYHESVTSMHSQVDRQSMLPYVQSTIFTVFEISIYMYGLHGKEDKVM